MKKLPQFLKEYFWDVDFEHLDAEKYSKYIIERILEYGDEKAIRWMAMNFSKERIKRVVCNTRALSSRSAIFWTVVLEIPKERVRCLSRDFQKMYRTIWRY